MTTLFRFKIIENKMSHYILGIDMGTTSIKACLLDADNKMVAEVSKVTYADMPSDFAGLGSLQNVPRIISVLHDCMEELPRELLEHVSPRRSDV